MRSPSENLNGKKRKNIMKTHGKKYYTKKQKGQGRSKNIKKLRGDKKNSLSKGRKLLIRKYIMYKNLIKPSPSHDLRKYYSKKGNCI